VNERSGAKPRSIFLPPPLNQGAVSQNLNF
jgi:hypothetical protein